MNGAARYVSSGSAIHEHSYLSVARQLSEVLHLALYCAGTQCSLMDPAGEVRRVKSGNSLRCPEAYLARTTLSTERQAASEGSEYCACRDL